MSMLLMRRLPSFRVTGKAVAIAMCYIREGKAVGFGGVFSLSSEPSDAFFGGCSTGDQSSQDGVEEGDDTAEPMMKSSCVRAGGENM
jgi:hypothetical protein